MRTVWASLGSVALVAQRKAFRWAGRKGAAESMAEWSRVHFWAKMIK